MKNQYLKEQLIEILGNGPERPLSTPDPIARIEYVSRMLTEAADKLKNQAKANEKFTPSLVAYKQANELREQVLGLADVALLINEFYELKQNKWLEFNTEYVHKGEPNE